jgi:hypothetical protein
MLCRIVLSTQREHPLVSLKNYLKPVNLSRSPLILYTWNWIWSRIVIVKCGLLTSRFQNQQLNIFSMSMCTMNTLKLQLAPRAPCLTRNTGLKPLQARKMVAAVRCSAQKETTEQSILEKAKLPAIAFLAAALMLAGSPDEALAARSGGRMGGSGFSSRSRR